MQYYASLIGPLFGLYYPLPPDLENEELMRVALNTSRLKDLWCSIYTKEETERQIGKYGGLILPNAIAYNLDYSSHEVELVRRKRQATKNA